MGVFAQPTPMSDSCLLPDFNAAEVAAIASRLFAIDGQLKPLHGERDLNYLVSGAQGRFVFKIANAEESSATLDCQHRVFERLAQAQVFPLVACARKSVNGREVETIEDDRGQQHYCRVLPFLEGRMWSSSEVSDPGLLADIGARLAALDQALAGFSHAGLERPLLWNMESTATSLDAYKPLLANDAERRLVEHFESGYRERVLPLATGLRRGVIHNDANRENVIIDDPGKRALSIIDFGDMIETWLVLEPAIAANYAMLQQDDPLASAAALVRGYHRVLPLLAQEIDILCDLVGMRLCMSVCLCAHQQRLEPDNTYLSIDVEDSWALMRQLKAIPADQAREQLMAACA